MNYGIADLLLPREKQRLRDGVLAPLQSAIVLGDIAPGELLSSNDLEQWMAGPGPVSAAALWRLSEQHLIEAAPRRLTRVAEIDDSNASAALELLVRIFDSYVGTSTAQLAPVPSKSSPEECLAHYWRTIRATARLIGNSELASLVARLQPRLERIALRDRQTISPGLYRRVVEGLGATAGANRPKHSTVGALSACIYPRLTDRTSLDEI